MIRQVTILWVLGLVATASVLFGIFYPASDPNRFALLTDKQIRLYHRVPSDEMRGLTMVREDGPIIRISKPSGYDLSSPVDFDFTVLARDDVLVDMATMQIDYRLGPTWIDVTRSLLAHAQLRGTHVQARGAELPTGQHAMRISVQDAKKRLSQTTISFSVGE